MSNHMDRILAQGVVAGLLAPVEETIAQAPRPWPLVLFTGIGAWFAAIPFAVLLYFLGGHGDGAFLPIFAMIVLCGAIVVLRHQPHLFTEQFALAGIVASALVLYFYLAGLGSHAAAALSICAGFAATTMLVPQTWLQVLLGAGMGISAMAGIYSSHPAEWMDGDMKLWAVLAVSILWCLLSGLPARHDMELKLRSGAEAIGLGMSAVIVCSPFWINDAFFFFKVNGWLDRWGHDLPAVVSTQAAVSVAVTLISAAFMAWKWIPCRSFWFAVFSLVLAVFAWCIPSLCVLALIGAVALVSGRKSTAILCAGMLVWWIGKFYFSLAWPLLHKAMLLGGAGGVTALTAAFLFPGSALEAARPAVGRLTKNAMPMAPRRMHTFAFLGCAVLTLGIVNASILQKEKLVANGTPVFVELAPVDPRSLMQGDYMRLAFDLPNLPATASPAKTNAIVGTVDERNVWSAKRLDDDRPLAAGEVKINLSGTPDHPIFVSEAWFFKEGDAKRWTGARFGELRVMPDGRAMLVTLRGPHLEAL